MTDKEAMQMALDALDEATTYTSSQSWSPSMTEECEAAATALRAALAHPEQEPFGYFKAEPFGWTDCAETDEGAIPLYERPVASSEALRTALARPEQEPVAWGIANTRPTERQPLMMVMLYEPEPSPLVVPLYTAPPQREWQGLTDEEIWNADEIMAANSECGASFETLRQLVHVISDKLKEKNT